MKFLFLYTELAGYFLACVRQLVEVYDAEVHIVRRPIDPNAPFKFEEEKGIIFHNRSDLDNQGLLDLADKVNPALLYCAGWIDKGYLKTAKHLKNKGTPVLLGLDNQWHGNLRQRVATVLARFGFTSRFTHAFVPGMFQYEYVRRLGFKREQILTGLYAADTEAFKKVYQEQVAKREGPWPRRLLYVGRFLDFKGITELYEAFNELMATGKYDWTLRFVGAGELKDSLKENEHVEVRGFVQPHELPGLAADSGAFVFPSRIEPWGVVLHEFTAAGLPVIATDAAGASTAFFRGNYNGFMHKAGDKASLKAALKKMMEADDASLRAMSRASYELSLQISPETWARSLGAIVQA